jgi:hypothetical protein
MAAISTENILSKTYIVYAAQSVQTLLYPTAVSVLSVVDTTLRNILGFTPYNKLKFGDFQSSTNSFAVSITNIFNGAKLLIANEITVDSYVNLTIVNLGLDKIVTTYIGFVEDVATTIKNSLSGVKDLPSTFNPIETNIGGTTNSNNAGQSTTDTSTVTNPPGAVDTRDNFDDSVYYRTNNYEYKAQNRLIQIIEP